ncbi:MAG: dihydroneopterin triphosphate 2'-epimerase [Cellvibrionaceae bacterium]
MSDQLATIRIKNLRLRAYIGIKDEEQANRQDVLVNVVIKCDAGAAITDNDISSALNYRTICKALIQFVEDNRFELLERMTHDALALVMENPQALRAEVEIDKVGALRYSDSVSISFVGVRDAAGEPWRG